MKRRTWILPPTPISAPFPPETHTYFLVAKNNGDYGDHLVPLLTVTEMMRRQGDVKKVIENHLDKLVRLGRLTFEMAESVLRSMMVTSGWGHIKGDMEEVVCVFLDMYRICYAVHKHVTNGNITEAMRKSHTIIARFNNIKE